MKKNLVGLLELEMANLEYFWKKGLNPLGVKVSASNFFFFMSFKKPIIVGNSLNNELLQNFNFWHNDHLHRLLDHIEN